MSTSAVRTMASRVRRGRVHAMQVPMEVLARVLAGDTEALSAFLPPEVADAVTARAVQRDLGGA